MRSLVPYPSYRPLKKESFHRTIVFAAQDTASSATSRILHILAQNPEAQARLRAEIRDLRGFKRTEDGNDSEELLEYDALMRLPYLDGVVRETLRLNPPVSWIWRMYVLLFDMNVFM